jgi:BirA family transcriptional regulator, biotin operon repressor / biotin---[acetyl-CoA-carboxylase] ligase
MMVVIGATVTLARYGPTWRPRSVDAVTSMYGDLDRPPLNADALARAVIQPGSLWTDLAILSETGSTNAVLKERAADDTRSGLVVIAEHQTAGRGRLDRTWIAPPRSGLTMSVLVRPYDVPAPRWSWLSLIAGLAVAASISEVGRIDAGLKWPNDVMITDKKVAGLLVERIELPDQPAGAVIGIGLNVAMKRAELPVETATSLAVEGAATLDRSVFARAILRSLEGLIGEWQRWSGDPTHGLHQAYVAACATLGKNVRIAQPDATNVEGRAVGIDEMGRLLVVIAGSQRAFGAGDVVHLRSTT